MAPSSTSSCCPPKDHQYNLRSKQFKRAPEMVVSVGQSSKRASRDQVADGPPKKKKKSVSMEVTSRQMARVGQSSKRASRDQVVDGLPKSVSMEDCVRTVAEILAATMRREQEEVDRALQMLEQDGVHKGSGQYSKAKSVFRDSYNRDVFMKLDPAEVRLGWINFLCDNGRF